MTPEITTLANGIRVATHRMPNLETVSLGVWVGVGARHERDEQHGLSHFLEHMAFKGTKLRSARMIAEEIESVGGDLNAATGLDTTSYFARVLKGDEKRRAGADRRHSAQFEVQSRGPRQGAGRHSAGDCGGRRQPRRFSLRSDARRRVSRPSDRPPDPWNEIKCRPVSGRRPLVLSRRALST